MTYWDRSKALNIHSLQGRRERYFTPYFFKKIVGAVQNISSSKFEIKTYANFRKGRFCVVPPLIPGSNAKGRSKIEVSFPKNNHNYSIVFLQKSENLNFEVNVLALKRKLDNFLVKVPDKLAIKTYT